MQQIGSVLERQRYYAARLVSSVDLSSTSAGDTTLHMARNEVPIMEVR